MTRDEIRALIASASTGDVRVTSASTRSAPEMRRRRATANLAG
jgi:hypothetical protein